MVGRPNVGKSTLVNRLVGRKVAIVTEKPQTTRNAIRGVVNGPGFQAVLVDTPGFHKPRTVLGERLNEMVRRSLEGVDVVVFLVDGAEGIGRGDEFLASQLAHLKTPVLACVNKVDLIPSRQMVAEALLALERMGEWDEILPISARTGYNVDLLLDLVRQRLPEGPPYFPEGVWTDQPEKQLVAEIIREKAMELTREEVPHSVAVVVEEMRPREGRDLVEVEAILYVERESQKGILIGKGGRMLKEIGSRARAEIEALLGSQVFLNLRVKTAREWQRSPDLISRMGY